MVIRISKQVSHKSEQSAKMVRHHQQPQFPTACDGLFPLFVELPSCCTHYALVAHVVSTATVLCRNALALNKHIARVRASAYLGVRQTALLRSVWVGTCGVARWPQIIVRHSDVTLHC